MPLWVESCNEWRKQLPDDIERVLQKYEKAKDYDNPEYKEAVLFFYRRHVCLKQPFPRDLTDTFANVEEDDVS